MDGNSYWGVDRDYGGAVLHTRHLHSVHSGGVAELCVKPGRQQAAALACAAGAGGISRDDALAGRAGLVWLAGGRTDGEPSGKAAAVPGECP